MLKLELENTLAVLQVEQSDYPAFLQELEAPTQLAAKAGHFILMGDFNPRVGNDAETWRGVIERNGLSALNPRVKRGAELSPLVMHHLAMVKGLKVLIIEEPN